MPTLDSHARYRSAVRAAIAHDRRGERHREYEREPVQHVEAVARRAKEREDEKADETLGHGCDLRDHERAAQPRRRAAAAYAQEESPQPDEGVVEDEHDREPRVQREHGVHREKATVSSPI